MTGVLWTGYVPATPCTTCKPGPDGSPRVGWALVAIGAAVLVAAIVMLAFAGGSKPEPDDSSAAAEEAAEPVAMDRVQREDLEQRAAKEAEEQDRSLVTLAGGLAVAGLVCAAFGGILVALTLSAVNDHKKQLHQAASVFVSVAVDGPKNCQEFSALPGQIGGVNSASHCSPSPRDYADQQSASDPVYTEFKLETVFSPNFRTDGEVTFHDTLNNRALCVRVPDSSSSSDIDAFITSGACPDAPVTDSPE